MAELLRSPRSHVRHTKESGHPAPRKAGAFLHGAELRSSLPSLAVLRTILGRCGTAENISMGRARGPNLRENPFAELRLCARLGRAKPPPSHPFTEPPLFPPLPTNTSSTPEYGMMSGKGEVAEQGDVLQGAAAEVLSPPWPNYCVHRGVMFVEPENPVSMLPGKLVHFCSGPS
ncbi:hypothetical protein Drorol1_Dr00020510 [Drosera rotundifolia]